VRYESSDPASARSADPVVPAVLADSVPVSAVAFRLIARGIQTLWARMVAEDPRADARPLLLSYDVHPTPDGPVLIEVNTNAGGILSALQAARQVNACCAEWEQDQFEQRLLALFRRDLLGDDPRQAGIVAIVDDRLATQPLLGEMRALARMMRGQAQDVRVLDAAELHYGDGRLRHGSTPIDRVYWRSTDFLLADPAHEPVRRAVAEGTTAIAPSPAAYRAIADKQRFVEWSRTPELACDKATGLHFRIAETVPLSSRPLDAWYADRKEWVFKQASGYASRGVYVGNSPSCRQRPTWRNGMRHTRCSIATARHGNTMCASSPTAARSSAPPRACSRGRSSACTRRAAASHRSAWMRPAACSARWRRRVRPAETGALLVKPVWEKVPRHSGMRIPRPRYRDFERCTGVLT
jgi:hypothetical protein